MAVSTSPRHDDVAARPGGDWPAQAADKVVSTVDAVRSRSTDRLQSLARILVYGTAIALIGSAVVVLVLVMLFQLVDNYLPPAESSWSTWLLFGVLTTLAGALAWAKRGPIERHR